MRELKKEFEEKCKEFSEKCTYEVERLTQEQFREVVYTSMFLTWQWIEQKIEQKCKEQREICSKIMTDLATDTVHPDLKNLLFSAGRDIYNAPSPKESEL